MKTIPPSSIAGKNIPGKYFEEAKSAAPSPTDTSDTNGKYFQNVSKSACNYEDKRRLLEAAKATGRFHFVTVGDKK